MLVGALRRTSFCRRDAEAAVVAEMSEQDTHLEHSSSVSRELLFIRRPPPCTNIPSPTDAYGVSCTSGGSLPRTPEQLLLGRSGCTARTAAGARLRHPKRTTRTSWRQTGLRLCGDAQKGVYGERTGNNKVALSSGFP